MFALTTGGRTEYLPEEDSSEAMRRFYEANQAGDPSAKLCKVEAANVPPPEDDPPPAAPGVVSPLALDRIQLQESWLAEAGFAVEPPLYAPGTRVLPLGDKNFRIERARVDRLPRFPVAAWQVRKAIATEARQDVHVGVRDLVLTDQGTLQAEGVEYGLEIGAFYQLATITGFGVGARYLAEHCDPQLRATNVNTHFGRTARTRTVTLRTRLRDSGARGVYATVTPTYTAVDTDEVLSTIEPDLTDAHTELVYSGSGIRAKVLWMPDQVVDLAAGDIFKVGVRVETSDIGKGRIRVSALVFRNRCLNLLIIGVGELETTSVVHKGSSQKIIATLREGILKARSSVGSFLQAWGHARMVRVDPMSTIRAWVDERKLVVPGERNTDVVVQTILAAFHKEPGNTLADCVNAVSRAAHEHPSWSYDIREELERQAARLVYVRA